MEDFSADEDYSSSDRDSLDGLDNEDSDSQWIPQKGPTSKVKVLDDSRPVVHRVAESFVNKFFPSGYPYSVNEGYLRYTQFRALQHLSSAALSVLSTQSLLLAAGLRPTPAQSTAASWILKDGMQHVGKLICSNLGARMDSEPKLGESWINYYKC